MRIIAHLLLPISIFCLSACGEKEVVESEVVEKEQEVSNTLPVYKVAVELTDYAPFKHKADDNTIIGFDIDLINAVAKESQFSVELIEVNFSDIITSVVEKKADISIAGLTETVERNKIMLASQPYLKSQIGYLVTENSPAKIATDLLDKKIAVQKNSYQDNLLTEMQEENILRKRSNFLTFQTIITKEADAALGEEAIMFYESSFFEKKHPVRFIPLSEKVDTLVIYGNKDQKELIDKINTGLNTVITNGKYQEINEKWFGDHAKEVSIK